MTKTFTSPINIDDGEFHMFIGHARSQMSLAVTEGGRLGQIDWTYTYIDGERQGETEYKQINLYLSHNPTPRLVHFEGVHELPEEAIELLEQNGFNAEIAKI